VKVTVAAFRAVLGEEEERRDDDFRSVACEEGDDGGMVRGGDEEDGGLLIPDDVFAACRSRVGAPLYGPSQRSRRLWEVESA
jgi:hypothetical protein